MQNAVYQMSKQNRDYIHGYTTTEQERLIQQSQYWRNDLILKDINYQSGDKLLEIGCGAGAVLGILSTAFPNYSSKDRQKLQ